MIIPVNNKTFWMPYIANAENMLNVRMPEELSYYMVMLLSDSLCKSKLAGNNQITGLLNNSEQYKDLLDQSLLISGMFPGRSLHLGAGSFAPMLWVGQQACAELAKQHDLYSSLANNYLTSLDIILCVRYQLTQKQLSKHKLIKLNDIGSNYPKLLFF